MTKIEYNGKQRNNVINNINSSIKYLNEVNNIFYNIDIPFDFKYNNTLINIKNDLKKYTNNISNYKDEINKFIEELNKDELELSSTIHKLEDIVIEKFDLNL